MDYLPGNPWTYDKDEIRLENIRKLRVMKYIQWKNAESEINSIISTYNNKGYNIWDLCDNRFKFIFNHRTNRFILDNDLNRNRIRNYSDYIQLIKLTFNVTTGWYCFRNKVHIPDRSLYELSSKGYNLIIEVSSRKKYTYDWENTIEEKLLKNISELNDKLKNYNMMKNLFIFRLDVQGNRTNKMKGILKNILTIYDDLTDRISEGEYLELMNYLKVINNLCDNTELYSEYYTIDY